MIDGHVSICQFAAQQAVDDPAAVDMNAERIMGFYTDSCDDTDLMVFPELAMTGYIPLKGYDQRKKRNLAEVAGAVTHQHLPRLVDATRGQRSAMVVGFMESSSMRNEIYNSVAYIEDGEILEIYRKIHLPVEENHYFVPGDKTVVVNARFGRVGLSICYDMLFPELSRLNALEGSELLLLPSNWLDIGNLRRTGEIVTVARAIENQCHVIFVNGAGTLSVRGHSWDLFGESKVITASGAIVACAERSEVVLGAELTRSELARGSDVFPVLRDRRPDLYERLSSPLSAFAEG